MIDNRLRNYLIVALVVAAAMTGARSAWRETVKIGCLPYGGTAPPGTWLVACASDQIGTYELGGLWFGLEPKAIASIQLAKVLLFGDSRMVIAMSFGGASPWFAARDIPMNLVAFGNGEQSGWADRLVEKLRPRPQLAVFDADPYFTGEQSIPAQAITDDPVGEEKTARATKAFIDAGATYCRLLGWLCGRTQHGYRQYLDAVVFHDAHDGRVWFNKNPEGSYPIARPGPQDTSHYNTYLANARTLIAKLHLEPRCIVFTSLPNSEMDDTLAKFLAANTGGRVVAPWLDGLSTSDHFHMAPESSREWSHVFFKELAPIVADCVGRGDASASAGGPVVGLK